MYCKSMCVWMQCVPLHACGCVRWCVHLCVRVYPCASLCLCMCLCGLLCVIVMGVWFLWSWQQHGETDYLSVLRWQKSALRLTNLTSKFNILLISPTNTGLQEVVCGAEFNLFVNIMLNSVTVSVLLFSFWKIENTMLCCCCPFRKIEPLH